MKIFLAILLIISLFGSMAVAQTKPKKAGVAATVPPKKTAAPSPGAAVYTQYCLVCHQADGGGVSKLNPSLRGASWVTGDKNRLITVLLKGLQNVEIDDETYDNAMPAHDFLTNQQIADVLTYIRSSFTNKADAVRPEEIAALR